MKKFVFLLIFFFFYTGRTFAQSPSPDAFSVSPSIARLDLAVDPSEADLYYKNNSSATIELQLSASDFTELEDGYKISFLQEKNAQNYHYALASWMKFEAPDILLSAHESKQVKVFIDKDRLTAGGHYGAILARVITGSETGNVQVSGILSSLIFVRTATGLERDDGKIEQLVPVRTFIGFPDSFSLSLHNTGNTDVIPYGTLTVTDMFGNKIAKGVLNEASLTTLPETIRRYTVAVQHSQLLLPGMYTVAVSLHFGKTNVRRALSSSFFSQGTVPLIPVTLAVLLISFLGIRLSRKKTRI